MRIQLSDGAIKDVPNEIAAQFIRAKKATVAPSVLAQDEPSRRYSPRFDKRLSQATPEALAGPSWKKAIFPRATERTPGSFAAKLGGDVLSLPFRALATAPAAMGAGDETIGESMARTGGRKDEPGWMQFLDEVLRSPVNAVLPGATAAGGMLHKVLGSTAKIVPSMALRMVPASLAIAGGNQAQNLSEGKPVSVSQAAIDAALAEALSVGVGAGFGKAAQKLSDRTGKAKVIAQNEVRQKMMPPDEALAMGITPEETIAPRMVDESVELTIPQIKRAERDLPVAEKTEAEARDAFMRMMKFLPGKANRSIWEAGFRLADDPKILEELLRDAKTIPDIVANQQAGRSARIAARAPITKALDATGKKIPVSDLVDAAREAVLTMRKGEAAPAEATRAVRGIENLLYTPPAGQRAVYRDPGTGDFATYPTYSGDLPINAETELLPSVTQDLKSALYSRARFETPDAGVREMAKRGAALKAKQALEEIDPTGKLKATNAAMADWIAASEGFLRAESRNANRDKRSAFMQKLFPQDSPEEIRRILLRAKAAKAAGEGAGLAGETVPGLILRGAATDNARGAR